MERLKEILPWDRTREVTFECEPGTLQEHKLQTLRDMGITRLSLGVENFKAEILQYNGRAHLEEEIHRAYGWARKMGFEQINIDLISGMVGETWDNWKDCIRKTIALAPDSVTIYQMELPYNTVFSKELKVIGQDEPGLAIADWPTKREWVDYAFGEFQKAGFEISSAYTVVRNKRERSLSIATRLWHGADMFGTGVASFGHVNGVHLQNVDTWEQYIEKLDKGEIPLGRALPVTPRDLLIRELILQLKTGRLEKSYFQQKYGLDITHRVLHATRSTRRGRLVTRDARWRRAFGSRLPASGSSSADFLRSAVSQQSVYIEAMFRSRSNRTIVGRSLGDR